MSRVGMTSGPFASWVETSIPISRNTSTAFGSILPCFRRALKTCVLGGRSYLAIASAMKLRLPLSWHKKSIFLSRILDRTILPSGALSLSTYAPKTEALNFLPQVFSLSKHNQILPPLTNNVIHRCGYLAISMSLDCCFFNDAMS
jgi:hypothetical protein